MQHGDVFSLDLSLFWEKKNANSAPANFIQLHLGELLTSKPANRQETCERKKKMFHLNALERNISICSD